MLQPPQGLHDGVELESLLIMMLLLWLLLLYLFQQRLLQLLPPEYMQPIGEGIPSYLQWGFACVRSRACQVTMGSMQKQKQAEMYAKKHPGSWNQARHFNSMSMCQRCQLLY
jgi:hypothetical protein